MSQARPRAEGPLARSIHWIGWSAVAALVMTALLAPSSVFGVNAPGNNGTVKVHEGATETEPIVHNEPHVCTFHLHFFFADPFQAGSWWIEQWAPGDKGQVVLSGTYNTNGSGEDRQPEQGAYQLPDGHYKLFWDGDTDKHVKMKVFWVECAAASSSPGIQSSQGPSEAPSEVAGSLSAAPSFESSEAPASEVPSEVPSGAPSSVPSGVPSEVPSGAPSGVPSEVPGSPSVAPSFESSQAPASESPTGAPGESFGGGVAGETSHPGGGVAGETTRPGGMGGGGVGGGGLPTLPNTATDALGTTGPNDTTWRVGLLGLAGLLAGLLVLTPERLAGRKVRR